MAEDVGVPEAGKPGGSKGFSEAAAGTCPPTHTHLADSEGWAGMGCHGAWRSRAGRRWLLRLQLSLGPGEPGTLSSAGTIGVKGDGGLESHTLCVLGTSPAEPWRV